MKKLLCLMLVGFWLVQLSGCSSLKFWDKDSMDSVGDGEAFVAPTLKRDQIAPTVLRVVGYGTTNAEREYTPLQRKLAAMRASKLDAYRTMAERVYGTRIEGNTTVQDLVVKNDKFRTFGNSYLHGARVVSIDRMEDGSYETILEMVIDEGFRNCITSEKYLRHNVSCRAPVIHDVNAYNKNQKIHQSSQDTGPLYYIDR